MSTVIGFTPFDLEDQCNATEGLYNYNLSSGTMPAMSLQDLLDLYPEPGRVLDSILNHKLDYSEQYGSSELRQALSQNLYPTNSPENFLISSGASEAIFIVFSTLLEADDSIIVQKPIYQSLYQVAQDRGVNIIDWFGDINQLQDLIKSYPEAKALVINNPNNPLGTAYKEDQLKQVTELLNGRYLISDEVFLYISQDHIPSAIELYDQAIVISDLSKSFNMPGLRLGWITTRQRKLLELFSSYKNYLSLRSSTLSEAIAPWLLKAQDPILNKNRDLIKSNIEYLYKLDPASLAFTLDLKPQEIQGLCIFPKLKPEFANLNSNEILKQQKTLILKGDCFGNNYKQSIRLGLGIKNYPKIVNASLPFIFSLTPS